MVVVKMGAHDDLEQCLVVTDCRTNLTNLGYESVYSLHHPSPFIIVTWSESRCSCI